MLTVEDKITLTFASTHDSKQKKRSLISDIANGQNVSKAVLSFHVRCLYSPTSHLRAPLSFHPFQAILSPIN